jgi:AraC-like DNA-binding protein
MRRLWQAIFELSADPVWPTRLALAIPFGAFGLLDYHASSTATVGACLSALAESFRHVATNASLAIKHGRGDTWIEVVNTPVFEGSVVTDEFTVATLIGRLRQLARGPVPITDVALTRLDVVDEHRKLLGTRVFGGAHRAAIHFARGALEVPLARPDPALRALTADWAARMRPPSMNDLAAQVRARILTLGPKAARAASVARSVGLSERTLVRRLEVEGTSFRAALGEVRRIEAERLLATTAMPLAEIADVLGYADQTTWTRAFTREHDRSPGEFRRLTGNDTSKRASARRRLSLDGSTSGRARGRASAGAR